MSRFRKFLGGLTSTAVVAGLATAGVVATATPAAAVDPVAAPNPTLQGCGIPITLVLDASSSINSSEQDEVRTAANAFLDGLDNTNSSVRVLQFSGTSANITFPRRGISSTTPPAPATSLLQQTKNEIQSKYHSDSLQVADPPGNPTGDQYIYPGTNWESALWFANQPVSELQNGLVVFITDGDPTRVGTTTSTGATETAATNAAIPRANALKTLGNRVLAVGVGSAIDNDSRENLKKVSGQKLVNSIAPGQTINDFDVLISDTFSGLEASLKSVASALCGGAITIQKLTDEGPNGSYVPAAGWNISAKVIGAENPDDFTWIQPFNDEDEQVGPLPTAPEPNNVNDPPKGTVQFQYRPKASWNTKNPKPTIRITETLDPNFDPRTNFGYRCEFPGSQRNAVQGDLTVDGGQAYFDVTNVTADQRLSCQIYNKHKRTTLRILKTVSGSGGITTADQWIMTATGPGNAPGYSEPGNNQLFKPVWANTEYTLDEIAPDGEADNYTRGQWSCDKGTLVGDKITIPAGTTEVTCAITNTRQTGTLKVVKDLNPNDDPGLFNLQIDGVTKAANVGDGGTTGDQVVNTGSHTVGETAGTDTDLGDYTKSIVCKANDGTGQTVAEGQGPGPLEVTVTDGSDIVCVITNTRIQNEVELSKVWVNSKDGDTADLEITGGIDPADGTATAPDGETISTDAYVGDTVTVSETVTGSGYYDQELVCKAGEDPVDVADDGSFTMPGSPVSCTYTNTRTTLLLEKVVEGKGDPHDWLLTATGPEGAPKVENRGDEGVSTNVKPGVEYTLAEEFKGSGNDNYTRGQWVCLPLDDDNDRVTAADVQDALNEDDLITLKKGANVKCTIINIRDLAQLKLVKQVEGADPNAWTLSATAGAPDTELNFSNKGGEGDFQPVYAGTQYQLKEEGPGGYSPSDWQCVLSPRGEGAPQEVEEINLQGDKITLTKGQRVTCTIINTRDLGSLTITKEFNPQQSGYTGTFDINYTCVDGATPVKNGTVKLAAGASETITGLPTGTTCTVTEPNLPANPTGWTFNPPTFSPANGQATVTTKDQTVSVTVVNSVAQVSPVVVKKICPIDATLVKPKPKKVGNKILTKKIKTNSSCVLVKPVVLCRPLASSAAGETAFCDTKVTKKGRITVKTKGYDSVRVTVIVRAKPKPGFEDRFKPNTWRKSWILK